MARIKRVQVLMDPADFARLEDLAGSEGTSVGELIRRAVNERYLAADEGREAAAAGLNALRLPGLTRDHLEGTLTVSRTEGLR